MRAPGGPTGRGATPWTVVHRTADDSAATRTVSVLLGWLAAQPDVELHTVLWLPGWTSTAPFELGAFHDVARDHRRLAPRLLRRAGRDRLAGTVTARAVRRTLSTIPPTGVVYLNGADCVEALRYLPAGERTVITHLHPGDRDVEARLPADRVQLLRDATDVWVATDEATRDRAAEAWGLDPDDVLLVDELVDRSGWERLERAADADHVALALAGSTWFRSDHTGRLVQSLLRLRPALELDLLWTEVEPERHLGPILHDLEILGVRDRVRLPSSHPEVAERLRAVDVLALTTPDEEPPWLAWDAALKGVPVVCFDTSPKAAAVGRDVEGRVVEYLDVVGMARAVLDLVAEERSDAVRALGDTRRRQDRCDVDLVGRRLVERAAGVRT